MLAQKNLATNYTNCTNWFWYLLTIVAVVVVSSCSSAGPTDVRTVVPGDALVYLETQDLGKALHAVTDNEAFRAASRSEPDFSALNGIKVGVAVTGFQTDDILDSDGPAELKVQPRFVAVAETNAWNYQAIKFAENKLGEFVNDIYGGGVELERFPRYDGDYFVWTANDDRKAYGLVIGSIIFFGNDETAIEKCVAVRKGEAESIAKNSKLPSGEFLASGYVSPDGVAQVSNIATIQLAVGAGEEEEVRGFIARVLPEILRKSIKEATWTARLDHQGWFEDEYTITLDPEVAKVLEQSIKPDSGSRTEFALVTSGAISTTRYYLVDAQLAWRGVLLTAQQAVGINGEIIGAISGSLFEPYGIDDPEMFLASIDGNFATVRLDDEGDQLLVKAVVKDLPKLKTSLAKELNLTKPGKKEGNWGWEIWQSDDGELAFGASGNEILLGHAETVIQLATTATKPIVLPPPPSASLAFTQVHRTDPDASLVSVLGTRPDEKPPLTQVSRVSTAITTTGIRRTETSYFGLIGSIIEQFAKEQ